MRSLVAEYPALAAQFLWRDNRLPAALPDPLWLHIGCGDHVLEDFLNLDFLPQDARVAPWELLDPWPASWPRPVRGALSEDTLEHFFLAEQLYILCEVNRALAPDGVFRVLMPAFDRLVDYCRDFQPRPGEFLHQTFGVETEVDAINVGLRFSGHRWLHDDASLAHLARSAGFDPVKTSCAQSSEPFLSGRNLRSEEGTAAFAHDLRRARALERLVLPAHALHGLELVERLEGGIDVLRVREAGARIAYRLPEPVSARRIACVNVRSANLGSFREHSLKRCFVLGAWGEGGWSLDETMKSRAAMNLLTAAQLRLAAGGEGREIGEIALCPGAPGDVVTQGPAEVFYFARP